MPFQTILVPTDFSDHSQRACEAAAELAKPLGAKLHLLHVLHLPVHAAPPEIAVMPVAFWQDLRAHAEKQLAAVKKQVEATGVRCDAEVIEDVPSFAISSAATRLKADLVVMGSHGHGGLKHALLGSVAERTVRSCPCPVLTLKHNAGSPWKLRTILVPTDFSGAANRALEVAKQLAKVAGPAHLILLHAYYVPIELEQYLVQQGDPVLTRLSDSVTKDLERVLTKLQEEGISSEYIATRGAPERLIVEIARDKKVDMIAMGTHGRRGLAHLLLGSVAERVVRTAECPVLTVREQKG